MAAYVCQRDLILVFLLFFIVYVFDFTQSAGTLINGHGKNSNVGGVNMDVNNPLLPQNKKQLRKINAPLPGSSDSLPQLPVANSRHKQDHVRMEVPGLRKVNPNIQHSPNRDSLHRESKPKSIKIAEHPACANDVHSLCSHGSSHENNFAVLDCLQNTQKDNQVSKQCQNLVWMYKNNLTRDIRFDSAAQEVCKEAIFQNAECSPLPRGTGELISCLIEHKENMTLSANCKQFLTRMASIVFSDYRLINRFTENCKENIEELQCGRFHQKDDFGPPHSQGKTVECLSENIKKLNRACKAQIMRIAELQADDYHLDRPLYYACRDDRERFCKRTSAGGGRIYKCLYHHKTERDMSEECRSKLQRRQRLIQEDYKADKRLAVECRQNIHELGCRKSAPKNKMAKLSHILLCLEGGLREGKRIKPECLAEMDAWRHNLLEDYQITPDLVLGCKDEINQHCGKQLEKNGKTLHCLMDLAKPEYSGRTVIKKISDTCNTQLQSLLLEADPFDDYRMDPTLQEACQHVVDAACQNVKPGEGRVLECLMDKITTRDMTEECEERLLEIQYFASRNFKLDPRLYKFCHEDAKTKCHAPEHWYEPNLQTAEAGPLVFQCLYSHYKRHDEDSKRQLSRACSFEVKRVMRQRAVNIDLEPRIEDPCLPDLAKFCSEKIDKGEEMHCLQDHLDELAKKCRWAVGNFTQDEEEDPQLDKILMRACTPMIKRFCEDLLENDDTEPADVMECLIKYKNNAEMNRKCQCGIEHHQLITMKDFKLSYKFKESCKKDVMKYCRGSKRKAEVVRCLSEVKRNDTLLEKEHRLSKSCRRQLRFEILARNENFDLDENLKKACTLDYKKFCRNVTPGNSKAIECLRKHGKDLSDSCHFKIFQREREEAEDNSVDYTFMKTCKNMINIYCREVDSKETLNCLKNFKDDFNFDSKCKNLITRRQIEQSEDYRLDPKLAKSCRLDIPKFCSQVVAEHANNKELFHGRLIKCLKTKFIAKRLSRECEDHMRVVIKEAAEDYRQDATLEEACKQEIANCLDRGLIGPQVEECLKKDFIHMRIKNERCNEEVARIVKEGHADVYVDPLLQRACQIDINHYCVGVPPGEGRQMSCLLAALDDPKVELKPECRKMLSERKEMWEYAAKIAPAETLNELFFQVNTSPSRHFFFVVIFSVIFAIFIFGLTCGRVTKRVKQMNKDK